VASFIRIAAATARLLGQHARRAGEVEPAVPSPPSSRSGRVLALAGYWGFYAALLVSAALVLGFLTIGTNAVWLGWLKFALGVTMLIEGLLLVSDWRGARRLVLERIQQRRGARGGERLSLSRRFLRGLNSLALQLLGLAWLGGGTLAAARGLEQIL
jgi:hypothetical protein